MGAASSGHGELINPAERGQVRTGEGSVKHVGAFRMDSVRTSILGGPRPLPAHRRADRTYTLNCEEPLNSNVRISPHRESLRPRRCGIQAAQREFAPGAAGMVRLLRDRGCLIDLVAGSAYGGTGTVFVGGSPGT